MYYMLGFLRQLYTRKYKFEERKLELDVSIFTEFYDSSLFREASKLRNYTSVYEYSVLRNTVNVR